MRIRKDTADTAARHIHQWIWAAKVQSKADSGLPVWAILIEGTQQVMCCRLAWMKERWSNLNFNLNPAMTCTAQPASRSLGDLRCDLLKLVVHESLALYGLQQREPNSHRCIFDPLFPCLSWTRLELVSLRETRSGRPSTSTPAPHLLPGDPSPASGAVSPSISPPLLPAPGECLVSKAEGGQRHLVTDPGSPWPDRIQLRCGRCTAWTELGITRNYLDIASDT